jgi:hypothetical protein
MYIESFTVSIIFEKPLSGLERTASPVFDDVAGNLFLNSIDMPKSDKYYAGHYIVITPSLFLTELEPLLIHRRQMGYIVDCYTLESIGINVTKEILLAFLHEKYAESVPSPDILLLVGDIDIPMAPGIPDYSWYEGFTRYGSDNRYGMWDTDDYIPDILVARMSVDSESELATLVKKTLVYETNPLAGGSSWLRKGLCAASYLHALSPPLNTLWVRELMMRNGYTGCDTLFDRSGYSVPTSQVVSSINSGVSYITYRGWGNATGWWEPEFKVSHIHSLSNAPFYPVMATVVCGTNDFINLSDPCFGEAFIRAGSRENPKGGVASWGPSDVDTHTKFNNPLNTGFFTAIFSYGMNLVTQAALFGRLNEWLYLPFERETSVAHYFYVYNTLSDPGLLMWSTVPDSIRFVSCPDTAFRWGGIYEVSVSPARSGINICMLRDGAEKGAFGITDETGTAQLFLTSAKRDAPYGMKKSIPAKRQSRQQGLLQQQA